MAEEHKRVMTGISGLDELLNGGFPEGGTYCILGEAGTGKSIITLEFIINGAAKYNEPGVYIMLEEDRERMLKNTAYFGWDIPALEDKGLVKLVPYIKSIVGDVESTFEKSLPLDDQERMEHLRQYLTVDSLIKEIEEACQTIGAKRVVIDPLTVVTILAKDQVVARMQIVWLIENLKRLNVTTLCTIEQGMGYWEDSMYLTEGTIYMMLKEKDGMFERGIMVRKIRGTSHDTSIRPLKITKEGIKVYPQEVIFR